MTPGPLPPHERAWRHPSELGAPAHEPTSRIGHVLIGSVAAVSLLLVAWLAISMTPKRYGDADDVRFASSDDAATSFGMSAGAPGEALTPAEHVLRVMSTIIAEQSRDNDETPAIAATSMVGADRPATDDTTSAEPTAPSTSPATAGSTAPDPPGTTPDTTADTNADATTGAVVEVAAAPVTDRTEPSSPGVAVFAGPNATTESSADPAAADSTASTSSTSSSTTSTTSSTTSTSTTSTSSTSTTSTSTTSTSLPPKRFA